MSSITTITMTVESGEEDDWREIDVEVRGVYVPYNRGTMIDDAEGGFAEDITAWANGAELELTPRETEQAEELLTKAVLEIDREN